MSCHKENTSKKPKLSHSQLKSYEQSKSFPKVDQTLMSLSVTFLSQGQKCWYPWKGLVTRNTPVKYQSSSSQCLQIINKVKVSDRITYRTKIICPQIFDFGGIIIVHNISTP